MKINISGHHVEITDAIKHAIEQKFAKIALHFPELMIVNSIVTVEPHQQQLEVTTNYEGNDISVKASAKELYAAIAAAAKKLEVSLARRKGILTKRLHQKYQVDQSDPFQMV